jgi:hypothetical protein
LPLVEIRNRLPVDIIISFAGEKVCLAKGKSVGTSAIKLTHGHAEITLQIGSSISVHRIDLKKLSPLKLEFKDVGFITHIAVRAKAQPDTKQLALTFFAPVVVYNHTGIPLKVADSKALTGGPIDPQANMVMWGAPSYFATKNPELLLPITFNQGPCIEIDVLGVNPNGNINLPRGGDLVCPISYTITSAQPFAESMVVTLSLHLSVENLLPMVIQLWPQVRQRSCGSAVVIKPKETVGIVESGTPFHFNLSVGTGQPTAILLEEGVHSTILTASDQAIEISIEIVGVELKTSFRQAWVPQPVNISNVLFDQSIVARDGQGSSITVPPLTTRPFAFRDCMKLPCIEIVISTASITVTVADIFRLREVTTPSGSLVFVNVIPNPNSTKSIVVCDNRDIVDHGRATRSELDVRFRIPFVRAAVISPDPYELALVSLTGITFNICRDSALTTFQLSVHNVQVDDLDPTARLPVAVLGNEWENNEFFEFQAVMFNAAPPFTSFDAIRLKIQPLVAYADIAFISDMMAVMKRLNGNPRHASISPPAPSEAQLGRRNKPFTAHLLSAEPLSMMVYVINKSGRAYLFPKSVPLLKICPNITSGARISVEPDNYEDISISYGLLKSMLAKVQLQIRHQIRGIILQTDFVYPPFPPIGQRFTRTRQRCNQNPARIAASLAFQPIENVFQKVQQVLSFVRFDDDYGQGVHGLNQRAGATVASGLKQAGKTMLSTFTGVVLDPLREGKKSKYKSKVTGTIAGIAKGISGLVVKPIQAVAQAGAALTTGARKAVEGDSKVLRRARDARAFPERQIIPYDPRTAKLRTICAASKEDWETTRDAMILEDLFEGPGLAAVLTRRAIIVLDAEGEIKWSAQIDEIVEERATARTVCLIFPKKQREFECLDGRTAERLVARVASKRLAALKFASAIKGFR